MPIEKWSESIAVLHLADDPAFSEDMETLEREGPPILNVVLDFAGVKFMNSSNIAALLRVRRKLSTGDRKLVLCNVANQVWSTLLLTGLDKIFEVTDAVPTALATIQMAEPKKTAKKKS
ncbi:MAG: STAS domain-containing protein [Tepidisphaeraceae bacterium]|jgi:anti-anti-sigma factor